MRSMLSGRRVNELLDGARAEHVPLRFLFLFQPVSSMLSAP